MLVYIVKMKQIGSSVASNHSCWAKEQDAQRQSSLRNNFHKDCKYWVEAVDCKILKPYTASCSPRASISETYTIDVLSY